MNNISQEKIKFIAKDSWNRFNQSIRLIKNLNANNILEIGVHKAVFSAKVLDQCESVSEYIMIDPWRHIHDMNNPLNESDKHREYIYNIAMKAVSNHKDKVKVLRGKTSEVIDSIPDNSLDFVYVDGDHTLRGITIDMMLVWDKVKEGGMIVCDDYWKGIWLHGYGKSEPNLIFPWVNYFAEAKNCPVYALKHGQCMIYKRSSEEFKFYDFSNRGDDYKNPVLIQAVMDSDKKKLVDAKAAAKPKTINKNKNKFDNEWGSAGS